MTKKYKLSQLKTEQKWFHLEEYNTYLIVKDIYFDKEVFVKCNKYVEDNDPIQIKLSFLELTLKYKLFSPKILPIKKRFMNINESY